MTMIMETRVEMKIGNKMRTNRTITIIAQMPQNLALNAGPIICSRRLNGLREKVNLPLGGGK